MVKNEESEGVRIWVSLRHMTHWLVKTLTDHLHFAGTILFMIYQNPSTKIIPSDYPCENTLDLILLWDLEVEKKGNEWMSSCCRGNTTSKDKDTWVNRTREGGRARLSRASRARLTVPEPRVRAVCAREPWKEFKEMTWSWVNMKVKKSKRANY